MDANGQRFWMLADSRHFALSGTPAAAWDESRRVLHLCSQWDGKRRIMRTYSGLEIHSLPADREAARQLAGKLPVTVDAYGTFAAISQDRTRVEASGVLDSTVTIYPPKGQTLPEGKKILDLSMGIDGILYLITGDSSAIDSSVNNEVIMADRLDRWDPVTLSQSGFVPDRIVAHGQGGAWALDRGAPDRKPRLARVTGMPLRNGPMIHYSPGTARPCRENPNPPRLELRDDLVFPENRDIIAMAANPIGQVAFLLWPSNNTDAVAEIIFLDNNRLSHAVQLSGAIAPFSIGWVEGDRWAVLFKDLNEALTYRVPRDNPPEKVEPAGDHFPLVIGPSVEDRANRPFCNTLTQPVYYQASPDGTVFRPKPLYRLSMQELATGAMVKGTRPFDSGQRGTVWHRIYLEASLPPGTGVKVFLAASDDAALLEDSAPVPLEDMLEDSVEDNEHCFGSVSPSAKDAPVGSWVPEASEIPFHPGLLYCQREKDHAGLFTALVQHPGRRVRTLKGRYLRVKLELTGNGHVSPEISAVRIYAPRFSYVDHYLPELYRETEFGPQADAIGAATGADFLQRFLSLFEGILTSIEDKIAAAHLVTDAYCAPPEALDWLAGWIGLTLEPGLPLIRKRRMISEATRLYRERATLNGLKRALNITTDDLVDQGGIVIVEDFRLRRTFATILGADLADEEDPLMMGIVASGNSFVGDTLFLGEEEEKEFLALYTPDIPEIKEEKAVQNLFERLANRITVLVHREMPEEELRLVRRIVELEIPAHVQARIFVASNPLLVGLSSLVSVDTYISERKQPQAVQVGKSRIGRGDRIQDVANLDPRLE